MLSDEIRERIAAEVQVLMIDSVARFIRVMPDPLSYTEVVNSLAANLADAIEANPDIESWSIEWGDPDGPVDLHVHLLRKPIAEHITITIT